MAMKILKAREYPTVRKFRVLLDDTKVDTDGNPDPAYVRDYEWGTNVPLARVKAETKLLAQGELDRMSSNGNPVTGINEGDAL